MKKKVEVTWEDAAFESEDLFEEVAKDLRPLVRSNVGYVVVDNADKLVISFGVIKDVDRDKEVCAAILVIPKRMIKDISYL